MAKNVITDLDNTAIHSISPGDIKKHNLENILTKYKYDIILREMKCDKCDNHAVYLTKSGRYCNADVGDEKKIKIYIEEILLDLSKKRVSYDKFIKGIKLKGIVYILYDVPELKRVIGDIDTLDKYQIVFENNIDYYVFFRPYFDTYIQYCSTIFSLSIWTAATKDYAEFILHRFPNKINHLFYDDHVDQSEKKKLSKITISSKSDSHVIVPNYHHKDLRMLGEFMKFSDTVIIDDRHYVYDDQPDNCIHLKAFLVYDDKHYDNGKVNLYTETKGNFIIIKGKRALYYDLLVDMYEKINNVKLNISQNMNGAVFVYEKSQSKDIERIMDTFEDRTLLAVIYILHLWNFSGILYDYDDILESPSLDIPDFIAEHLNITRI